MDLFLIIFCGIVYTFNGIVIQLLLFFLEYMLAQWVSAQRNKISRFEYPQNTRYEFEFSMVLVPVRYSIVSVLQGGVQSRVLLRTKLLVQT